jgi:hypothetical protein
MVSLFLMFFLKGNSARWAARVFFRWFSLLSQKVGWLKIQTGYLLIIE